MESSQFLKPNHPPGEIHTFLKELVKVITMGAASPFLETFLDTGYFNELYKWQIQVANEILSLKEYREYQFDVLLQNEEFISTFVHCVELARRNHRKEKRDYLKNAVINSVKYSSRADLKPIFLRYIDELTVDQILLLKFLFDHPEFIGVPDSYTTLKTRLIREGIGIPYHNDTFKLYLDDLKAKGLIDISVSYKDFNYTYSSPLKAYMDEGPKKPDLVVLNLAHDFLAFILENPIMIKN